MAFRLSTPDTILDLAEDIYNSLKKYHIIELLDLKETFDTVKRDILLRKLQLHSIRGLGNKWIQRFLTDGYNYVDLGNIKSGFIISSVFTKFIISLIFSEIFEAYFLPLFGGSALQLR